MKARICYKDPDYQVDLFNTENLSQEEYDQAMEKIHELFPFSEYVSILVDTETKEVKIIRHVR